MNQTRSGQDLPVQPTRLRMLCVEDNPVNAVLMREIIAIRPRIDMRLCVNARSALQEAPAFVPQVAMLDLQLPDMNGVALMQQLRNLPDLAGCRYIALSAHGDEARRREAVSSGFDEFWDKPIDLPLFLARLDKLTADVLG